MATQTESETLKLLFEKILARFESLSLEIRSLEKKQAITPMKHVEESLVAKKGERSGLSFALTVLHQSNQSEFSL